MKIKYIYIDIYQKTRTTKNEINNKISTILANIKIKTENIEIKMFLNINKNCNSFSIILK